MFSGINVSEFSLVLFTGLAEMIVSFLHMMFADNLGRLLYIIFSIKTLFLYRKIRLLSSELGCSLAAVGLALLFWSAAHPDQMVTNHRNIFIR